MSEMTYASPSTWLVLRDEGMVYAYSSPADATSMANRDESYFVRKAPSVLARRRFVWAVIGRDHEVDSFHGGDADAATRRALQVDGVVRCVLVP